MQGKKKKKINLTFFYLGKITEESVKHTLSKYCCQRIDIKVLKFYFFLRTKEALLKLRIRYGFNWV